MHSNALRGTTSNNTEVCVCAYSEIVYMCACDYARVRCTRCLRCVVCAACLRCLLFQHHFRSLLSYFSSFYTDYSPIFQVYNAACKKDCSRSQPSVHAAATAIESEHRRGQVRVQNYLKTAANGCVCPPQVQRYLNGLRGRTTRESLTLINVVKIGDVATAGTVQQGTNGVKRHKAQLTGILGAQSFVQSECDCQIPQMQFRPCMHCLMLAKTIGLAEERLLWPADQLSTWRLQVESGQSSDQPSAANLSFSPIQVFHPPPIKFHKFALQKIEGITQRNRLKRLGRRRVNRFTAGDE